MTQNNTSIDQQIAMMKKAATQNAAALFYFWQNYWTETEEQRDRYTEIAQCFLQMEMLHINSILILFKGTPMIPHLGNRTIIDIPSMTSILRSLYEKVFIFNNLFVEQENTIEKEIVLCIWEIRGLYNRKLPQNPQEAEKYRKIYNSNMTQIKGLRQRAISLLEKLDITEDAKQAFHKEINKSDTSIKGYKFIKDTQTQKIKEFKILSFSASPKEIFPKEDLSILYSYLSYQSHPSFLGTLQFGQMYNSDEYKKKAFTILNSICKFQQVIVRDFCNAFPKAKEILDKMSKEQTKYLF
ncbi:DUF5677 domain-containing protein [Prevotella sp. HUN102]|uniref:DUF5677 domain-containing protein n=1 Tax=Prevotella sp. HUN102 TaxID=1392486 RepID=UPI00068C37B4|nr:DUF5677 domain-containing protein [Prevotella sp. HUN102]